MDSPYLIQSLYRLLVLPVLLGEGGQVDLLAGQQMECVLRQQSGRESGVCFVHFDHPPPLPPLEINFLARCGGRCEAFINKTKIQFEGLFNPVFNAISPFFSPF